MKTRRLHLRGAAAILATALAPLLPAQTAPGDEVVRLSEFQVSSVQENSYLAADSITGTRVASALRDLPFNVNVVTGEFLEDFAAYELKEQFAYVSSVSPNETQGGSQVRGFETDQQLRNGFRRLGLIDKVNVDRAEVIKGPAASIYGKIQPGGVVNIITKKPGTKPRHSVSFAAGTNEFYRAQAWSTGPVGGSKTLFYRQDLAANSRKFDQPFKETDGWTTATQLLWRPRPDTSVSFEVEYLFRHEKRGNSVMPVSEITPDPYRQPTSSGAPRTYGRYTRTALELFNFNHQGPQEFNDREVFTLTAALEHRFSEVTSLRVGANWFDRAFNRVNVSGDVYRPDLGLVGSGATFTATSGSHRTPVFRPIDEGGASVQIDLLNSFSTGKVDHKLLVTLDYNRTTEDGYEARMPPAIAANPLYNRRTLSVTNPDYFFVSWYDRRDLYGEERENRYNSVDNYGVFVSERATFLDGRLIALGGIRFDQVKNKVNDRLNGQRINYNLDDTTYQLGANFTVVKGVTLYGNRSTSFSPQARFNVDGTPLPNETGEGTELGVKLGLFQERLNLTAGYFKIERANIARETTDSVTSQRIVILSGEERAEGFEVDFNWQLTRRFQILGGYGYVDAITVKNDEFPFLVNTTPRRVPTHNLGLASRYEVKDGRFKGAYATLGVQYYSKSIINAGSGRSISASTSNPIINRRMPNGQLPFPNLPEGQVVTSGSARVDDGRNELFNNPYTVWDASVGYRWRDARKLGHKVQVNLKNLFDKQYTWGSGAQGDPLTLIGTYTLTF